MKNLIKLTTFVLILSISTQSWAHKYKTKNPSFTSVRLSLWYEGLESARIIKDHRNSIKREKKQYSEELLRAIQKI